MRNSRLVAVGIGLQCGSYRPALCLHGYASTHGLYRALCTVRSSSYTINTATEYCQEIKKSKFIGYAAPATTFEDAQLFMNKVKDAKATHNCWAYRSETVSRSSDDGEPSGTAGRPMLGLLESENLVDTVVMVTRYYGGTKLGTGGLARAYTSTAKGALELQERRLIIPTCELELTVSMDSVGAMYSMFQQWSSKDEAFQKLDESFSTVHREAGQEDAQAIYRVRVPLEKRQEFEDTIRNLFRGDDVVRVVNEG
jgi:uncharacterized YigZ family protein